MKGSWGNKWPFPVFQTMFRAILSFNLFIMELPKVMKLPSTPGMGLMLLTSAPKEAMADRSL